MATSHVAGSVLITSSDCRIDVVVLSSKVYDVNICHKANLFGLCIPFSQRKFVATAFDLLEGPCIQRYILKKFLSHTIGRGSVRASLQLSI